MPPGAPKGKTLRETALQRFTDILAMLSLCCLAGPALAWSCASDEPLTPQVTAAERARISAEVARERALAEALRCRAEGRADCPTPLFAAVPDATEPETTVPEATVTISGG